MHRLFLLVAAALVLSGALALSIRSSAGVTTGTLKLVSVDANGIQGGGNSLSPDISADGRFVVFTSRFPFTSPEPGVSQVWLKDLETGELELISANMSGGPALAGAEEPSVTDDGRYVVFRSFSTDLTALGGHSCSISGTCYDIYRRDRQAGVTELVSIGHDGSRTNGQSFRADVSSNGRFVVFATNASNLVPGATSPYGGQIILRDVVSQTNELIDMAMDGSAPNDRSDYPHVTADGRYVEFWSKASNLVPNDTNSCLADLILHCGDTFVRDRTAGTTERVSVMIDGSQSQRGASPRGGISDDGRFVVFASEWPLTNQPAGDGLNPKIYLRDRASGGLEMVSLHEAGVPLIGAFDAPSISDDGRLVSFMGNPSAHGSGITQVYLRNLATPGAEIVSLGMDGEAGDGESYYPVLSRDGTTLAFQSWASNLSAGDANFNCDHNSDGVSHENCWDVFSTDLCPLAPCEAAPACPRVELEAETILTLRQSKRWESITRYSDSCIAAPDLTGNEISYPTSLGSGLSTRGFGNTAPPIEDFLVWKARENPSFLASRVPVLLVHGLCGRVESTWNEMVDGLVKSGYRVFAISFSFPCGSIEPKAQALADAIQIIEDDLNVDEIDIVSHSMGGLVARFYIQDLIPTQQSVGDIRRAYPYGGDVRTLVMLGTPNGGFDQIFRHPQLAGLAFGGAEVGVAPSPWTNERVDVAEGSLFGMGGTWIGVASGAYDGVLEMTKRQPNAVEIQRIERPHWISAALTGEPPVVFMGNGVALHAFDSGIATAESMGGNFVDRLASSLTPPGTNYYLVAGTNTCVARIFGRCASGLERPSDGIVFVRSVFDFEAQNLLCGTINLTHDRLQHARGSVLAVVDFLRAHNSRPQSGPYVSCAQS